ncbi:hypothetical protein [Halobellus sp. H-GB7]|jgi:hypothetical protein|uniref:hypothetical protein n=1 Tax=Halobellus sp. H-GB7 TaxID=3069756 RepID=UPI0027B4DAC0|nr:hypothetical protein [Halobellus sp. H-GB7]MDQ2054819.1 hypothetical protein [Halobellus sp. H-GB7]
MSNDREILERMLDELRRQSSEEGIKIIKGTRDPHSPFDPDETDGSDFENGDDREL